MALRGLLLYSTSNQAHRHPGSHGPVSLLGMTGGYENENTSPESVISDLWAMQRDRGGLD